VRDTGEGELEGDLGESLEDPETRRACTRIAGIRVGTRDASGVDQAPAWCLNWIPVGVSRGSASGLAAKALLDPTIFE
jgi:hypothetical protein